LGRLVEGWLEATNGILLTGQGVSIPDFDTQRPLILVLFLMIAVDVDRKTTFFKHMKITREKYIEIKVRIFDLVLEHTS
jgi:hypothetical protein